MYDDTLYVLIHSPLVGGLTWKLVADQMHERGLSTLVPTLADQPASGLPFWKQHAGSVPQAFVQIPKSQPIALVAHSGAGPLLPAIRQVFDNPVTAYVFVDAGIPRDGASRLDLMRSEDPEWAEQFHQELLRGERFPTWSAEDLREEIPDDELRSQMVAEIHPRALPFFTEPIPVFDGWPDAPCACIRFSQAYERVAAQARQSGWLVREVKAGHFHMLVDPAAVTDMIVEAVRELRQREAGYA